MSNQSFKTLVKYLCQHQNVQIYESHGGMWKKYHPQKTNGRLMQLYAFNAADPWCLKFVHVYYVHVRTLGTVEKYFYLSTILQFSYEVLSIIEFLFSHASLPRQILHIFFIHYMALVTIYFSY